ncbi:MAG: hypothetical protein DLM68_17125 [Hyphomicrobiales bacterium]|nr:MAG: hypothetical protein DLM68_17125 [Hyphomicrobiales bacterium]
MQAAGGDRRLRRPQNAFTQIGAASCITLTKTVRDNQEALRLVNRIEDAKTERLLMDVAKVP